MELLKIYIIDFLTIEKLTGLPHTQDNSVYFKFIF